MHCLLCALSINFGGQRKASSLFQLRKLRVRLHCCLVTLVLLFGTSVLPLSAADDAWPQYAHDGALTGRTMLRGDLRSPRTAWSLSLAGTQMDVELIPQSGTFRVDTSAALSESVVAPAAAPLRDVDGSGNLRAVVENHQQRWAKILPDVAGLQQIRWDQTRTTAKTCHLQLVAFDQGYDQPRVVWNSEAIDTVFAPLMIVNDIDSDGEPEICVAMHYRVFIFNAYTGRTETEFRFHDTRSYGWFGLADVDGDEQDELIVLSDFQSHFDVLDFDPAKPDAERISVRWRREIEVNIDERQKWPQIGPRPVVDVTGDGLPEIVVNLYNDSGDGEWHLLALNAASGDVIADLPQRYTHGNADLDADGCPELFCMKSDGIYVPDYGDLEILNLRDGQARVLWTHSKSAYGLSRLPEQIARTATGAAQGLQHVLLTQDDVHPAFVVLTRRESTHLTALRCDATADFREQWSVQLSSDYPELLGLESREQSVLAAVRLQLPAGQEGAITGDGVRPELVRRQSLASRASAPVTTRDPADGTMKVFVEGAAETLFAVQPPIDPAADPQILWQRPGRGIGNQSGTPVAVDLDGDESPEVVVATRAPTGAAQVSAYRVDGREYWTHTFEQTPGARPVHNVGALSYWWPGRFRQAGQTDLFVNTRRGLMHSDVGHLLDGRSGERIWTREKAIIPDEFQWGYTGKPVAVADLTGDSIDEITNLYPVCYWMAAAADGRLISGRDLASQQTVPAWAAYGEPVIFDFTGDGRKEVLLDCPYILAVLTADGNVVWHGLPRASYPTGSDSDNIGETTSTKHALIDFDADGRFELASAGYNDGVRAIDAATGEIRWSVETPAPTSRKCTAADIDGRPGDELIYAAGRTLIVITGDADSGRVLWTWEADGSLSLPAVTDVDGDGLAEILVQSATGTLHCLDGAQH